MSVELRVPGPDEFAAFAAPIFSAFTDPEPSEETIEDERRAWEPERALGAVVDGAWVGATGAFSFDLTLPGGTTTAAAGVTNVGVLATHRRQGVLTAMMRRQLDDIAEAGESIAILTASETGIYGRFGYGVASQIAVLRLASDRGGFLTEPDVPGRCRLVPREEAKAPFAAVYERCRRLRAGAVSRSERFWDKLMLDRPDHREGAGKRFHLLHVDADGHPDGFAGYRIEERWPDRLPQGTVVVTDLYGLTPSVEAALWRHLCEVDLTTRVVARARPVDDPIRWRLAEPRQLVTTGISDWLWARVLDVPAALEARRYRCEGQLVIEVVDGFRPTDATHGRFRLEGGPDGAVCKATGETPELTLGAADLGALLLGGVAPSTLAAAGRVDEHAAGALARADLLLVTDQAPYCGTMF